MAGMRVDLDAVERLARDGNDACRRHGVDVSHTVTDQDALALVAELRAAREVVETRHATPAKGDSLDWDIWWDIHHGPALADYDRVVTS
jgi:hypothetical protein